MKEVKVILKSGASFSFECEKAEIKINQGVIYGYTFDGCAAMPYLNIADIAAIIVRGWKNDKQNK